MTRVTSTKWLKTQIVHEGAHLLYALFTGVFRQVNFMGLGVQVDVFRERMTDTQLGIFCLVGALATFCIAYLLTALAKKICTARIKLLRAVLFYITIALLLIDPLSLSILCGLFGGGDMNGIAFLLPEWAARIGFGALLIVNGLVIWKLVLPVYSRSFFNTEAQPASPRARSKTDTCKFVLFFNNYTKKHVKTRRV